MSPPTGERDKPSVLLSRDGAVATVTLNRPHRKNALDFPAWLALDDILRTVRDDADIRVVVLTGAGNDFCAGADIGGIGRGDMHPLEKMRRFNQVAQVLHDLPKPTVAKVRGVAAGAGWNLALHCDLVVAAVDARFCQIFARRGMSPDVGGSWLLPRMAGLQQAKLLAFLADFVTARQAFDLGLVTVVADPDEVDREVTDLAARLAVAPAVALAQTKALLNHGSDRGLAEAMEAEAAAQVVNFATADVPAAMRAFAEKKEPTFTGRWRLTASSTDGAGS